MDAGEFLLSWLAVSFVGTMATAWWSHRLWQHRTEGAARTKIMAAVVAAAVMFGAFGTLVGLVKAFGVVGGVSVDPSMKAVVTTDGNSGAMNWTAFGLIVWMPTAITLAFAVRERRARSR